MQTYSLFYISEVATSQSPECCAKLIREGGIHIMFGVMSRCNRSVPNQDIFSKACNIVLNVAKVRVH